MSTSNSPSASPAGVIGMPNAAQPAETCRPSAAVDLPAELGIEQGADLQRLLAQHAGDDEPVTLDAAEIRHIHTAALQLFCMFCRDRRTAGRQTRFARPSQALRSAAALLGATTLLSLGAECA